MTRHIFNDVTNNRMSYQPILIYIIIIKRCCYNILKVKNILIIKIYLSFYTKKKNLYKKNIDLSFLSLLVSSQLSSSFPSKHSNKVLRYVLFNKEERRRNIIMVEMKING